MYLLHFLIQIKGDGDSKDICPYTGFHVVGKKNPKQPHPKTLQNQQKNLKKNPLGHFGEFCHHKRRNTKRFRKGASQLLAWCVGISPLKVYLLFLLGIAGQTRIPGGQISLPFCGLQRNSSCAGLQQVELRREVGWAAVDGMCAAPSDGEAVLMAQPCW